MKSLGLFAGLASLQKKQQFEPGDVKYQSQNVTTYLYSSQGKGFESGDANESLLQKPENRTILRESDAIGLHETSDEFRCAMWHLFKQHSLIQISNRKLHKEHEAMAITIEELTIEVGCPGITLLV